MSACASFNTDQFKASGFRVKETAKRKKRRKKKRRKEKKKEKEKGTKKNVEGKYLHD
jgi:hypothetical protein